VVTISGADGRYSNDQGEADPAVSTALAAYASGTGTEHAALEALAGSRLLVPVVASPAEDGSENGSEMALPSLVGRDGRQAVPAFTSADAVRQWQPQARPVPVPAASVFAAAQAESQAVVIDVGGPVPVAIEGAGLDALASGGPVPRMHEDPDVWQLVADAAGRAAPGTRVRLRPAPDGAEFVLEVAPPEGKPGPVPDSVASDIAASIKSALCPRVRSAVAVVRLTR
jgi:hypothetical protein